MVLSDFLKAIPEYCEMNDIEIEKTSFSKKN